MPIVFEEVQAEIEDTPIQESGPGNSESEQADKLNERQLQKMLKHSDAISGRIFAD